MLLGQKQEIMIEDGICYLFPFFFLNGQEQECKMQCTSMRLGILQNYIDRELDVLTTQHGIVKIKLSKIQPEN